MKKYFYENGQQKKSRGGHTYIRKIDFKNICKRQEHYKMMQGLIQENITIIYALNITTPKDTKQI